MRAQEAINYATAVLSGQLASDFEPFALVDRAAIFMESMREWRYIKRTARNLQFRAAIDATTASYTASSTTLTKTGAFASYTLVPGDFATLTDGSTLLGSFPITAKTDSDNLVLDSAGLASNITGPLTIHINTARVALPSDVGRIQRVVRGQVGGAAWPSRVDEIVMLDESYETGSTHSVGVSVEWAQLSAKATPVQTLRIWPEPQTAEANAIALVYLRDWPTTNSDEDILPIPRYMEQLLLECVRMTALGYDENMRNDEILSAFDMGAVYEMACRHDTGQQRFSGKFSGTAVAPRRTWRDEGDEFVLRHIQN